MGYIVDCFVAAQHQPEQKHLTSGVIGNQPLQLWTVEPAVVLKAEK